MSMYDIIKIDRPDLGFKDPEEEFQTKDIDTYGFGGSMTTYTIDREGKLWEHPFEMSANPDWSPLKEDGTPKTGFEALMGSMIRIEKDPVCLDDYHGDIIFYDRYREYKARFSNGKLDWIKSINFRDSIREQRGAE